MGKKIRVTSDPKLAKSHKKGAVVDFVQPAVHPLGLIYVHYPYYWSLHARYSSLAYERLKSYIDVVLAQPADKSNARSIHDFNLINKMYKATCDLVIHSYLLFEYLSLSILTAVYLYPGANDEDKKKFQGVEQYELKDKVRHILKNIIKRPDLVNSKGYSMLFQELEQIRHSINHPTNDSVYNAGKNTWDKVPLAWAISGKAIKYFDEMTMLFNAMYKEWNKVQPQYSKPVTLTGVQRGIESLQTTFVKKRK